jgi:tetratricopeptide (TPR) repeat protein
MRNAFSPTKLLGCVAVAASLSVVAGGCASTTTKKPPESTSWTDKVTQSFKNGTAKVAAALKPKETKVPVATSPPSGKAGPNVFVAVAQAHENLGDLNEAEAQYKKALDLEPNHLPALLGYARLEDRRHNFDAAIKLYQQAMKKHSKESMVHNDLGLCYHRRGMLPEATKELQKAVELNQQSKLYRNNLAAVLVDQGRQKEALQQLTIAHGEPVAHYNLGYLLEQKKNHSAALAEFRKAAEIDPSLSAAQQWVAKLSSPQLQRENQLALVAVNSMNQSLPSTTSEQQSAPPANAPPAGPEGPSSFRFLSTTPAGSQGRDAAVKMQAGDSSSVQFPPAP